MKNYGKRQKHIKSEGKGTIRRKKRYYSNGERETVCKINVRSKVLEVVDHIKYSAWDV